MNKKGFTIIELLVCIMIIALLIAIAIPGCNKLVRKYRGIKEPEKVVQVEKEYSIEHHGLHVIRVVGLKYEWPSWERGYGKCLADGLAEVEKSYVIYDQTPINYYTSDGSITKELLLRVELKEGVSVERTPESTKY
jgi:prepilin-type N-terminal cleavage/methylation domain-containing protein